MTLLELRNRFQINSDIDTSDLEYYQSECDQLQKEDLTYINIKIYGYDGNKTKHLGLNKESLLALMDLMIRQGVK